LLVAVVVVGQDNLLAAVVAELVDFLLRLLLFLAV
jgi:hypothetical protein